MTPFSQSGLQTPTQKSKVEFDEEFFEDHESRKQKIMKRLVSSQGDFDPIALRPTLRKKVRPLDHFLTSFLKDHGLMIPLILKLSEFCPLILIKFMMVDKGTRQGLQTALKERQSLVTKALEGMYGKNSKIFGTFCSSQPDKLVEVKDSWVQFQGGLTAKDVCLKENFYNIWNKDF